MENEEITSAVVKFEGVDGPLPVDDKKTVKRPKRPQSTGGKKR